MSSQGSKKSSIHSRLYRGETKFDFVGRAKWWFVISGIVIVVGMASLGTRGLNLSIDFKGGVSWEVTAQNVTVTQAQNVVAKAGLSNPTVTILGGKTISVDAKVAGSQSHRTAVENTVSDDLAKLAHTQATDVSVSFVGPSWGGNISSKAIEALVIFFAFIALYISLRFEWRMAVAAIVAVLHDLLVTVGIYALSGFQVTPDTVIAVLTILGYSLYDTVVVFDRIDDHMKGVGSSGRLTYSDTVNLSMNQVLMRSINTSLVAILPILSVLVLGAYVLGATTLQYFGLALVIGLTSGAYSSIFIASPLLAILKEREPRYATIRRRLEARGTERQLLSPAELARAGAAAIGGGGALAGAGARSGGGGVATASAVTTGAASTEGRRVIRPGSAKQGSRPSGQAGQEEFQPVPETEAGEAVTSLASRTYGGGSGTGSGSAAVRPPRPRKKTKKKRR